MSTTQRHNQQQQQSQPSSEQMRAMGRSSGHRQPMDDVVHYLREYAREKPEVAALWCFGIGFVLGWKLKPW